MDSKSSEKKSKVKTSILEKKLIHLLVFSKLFNVMWLERKTHEKYWVTWLLPGSFYLTITTLYMINDRLYMMYNIYNIYLIKNAKNIWGQKFLETRNLNENYLAKAGTNCPVNHTDSKPSFIFVKQLCLLFSFFHREFDNINFSISKQNLQVVRMFLFSPFWEKWKQELRCIKKYSLESIEVLLKFMGLSLNHFRFGS